jgi:chemotaxis protein methyltransferase CheR/type IV pilus assembly protein PilK
VIPVHENTTRALSWPVNGIMPMFDAEYGLWTGLLEERLGVVLAIQRKSFLLSKLSIRMHELGVGEYKDYFAFVTAGTSGRVEWEILVDRLTIHETRFFRDTRALSFITHAYFEKLNFVNTIPNVHIWSVGCSTGEEPYSLMMYIDKHLKDNNKKCYLAVTASDVSNNALAVGKKAIYPRDRFKNVPAEYVENYVETCGKDHFQISEALRKRICFNRFNLINISSSSAGKMEIIICQNVLIYFNRDKRLTILNQLVEYLVPGGLLIVGAGEISNWSHAEMNSIQYDGILAFQRKVTDTDVAVSQQIYPEDIQQQECNA